MSNETVKKNEQASEVVTAERSSGGRTFTPRFDIWETDSELILYGDLPGVAAESIDIEFENDVLTIEGHVEPRNAETKLLFGEYGIGDFCRSFTIGETIDSEEISAEMRSGVLTLHLPKTASVKPRRIEVKTA